MSVGDVVVFVVLLAAFAIWIGGCLALMRASWRLIHAPRRPPAPRLHLPPPPDDWDDEEYVARHHH